MDLIPYEAKQNFEEAWNEIKLNGFTKNDLKGKQT